MKGLHTITVLFGASLTVMAGTAISPALPGIADYFSGLTDAANWARRVLTAPALFIVLTAPIAGLVIDRVGPKPVFLTGLGLYAVAGTSGLWVDSLTALLIGRAALGIAVGLIMPSCSTLIGILFVGPERVKVVGWQAACMTFGGVIFLIMGGLLAETGWRGPFAIYLASLLILPGVLALPHRRAETPPAGAEGFPWSRLIGVYLAAIFGMACFFAVPTQTPFLLVERGTDSSAVVGLTIASASLAAAIVALFYRRVRGDRSGTLMLGLAFVLIGMGLILVAFAGPYGNLLASIAIVGLGFGVLLPTLQTMVLAIAPDHSRGRATGLLTMSVFIGQFLSADLTGFLASGGHTHRPFLGFGLIAATIAIGVLAGNQIRVRRRGTVLTK
ncbi:MAG: MFS transporter [Pseudomonadota bacterium]